MSSAKTIIIAPVRKSLTVGVSQEKAFEVFTAGVDRWWPKEHHRSFGDERLRDQAEGGRPLVRALRRRMHLRMA